MSILLMCINASFSEEVHPRGPTEGKDYQEYYYYSVVVIDIGFLIYEYEWSL